MKPNRGGSYIDSPYWIKNKKPRINPINKRVNKCFQYIVTLALNHDEIKKDLQGITKIKPFINKYNWDGINFSSEKDYWKKIGKNNVTIDLNFFYAKKEKIYTAYVSKYNSNLEKQVIFLMILNGKKPRVKSEGCEANSKKRQWHYLAVKKLSALLGGITSESNGDFYCLNCLHYFRTKNKLESHKKLCENKDICNAIMPSEGSKILELNQYQKSDKALFIIFVDLECIIEWINGYNNNPKNLLTTKFIKHIPLGFSMPTIYSFISIENKLDVYRDKDCMKKFCQFLSEHAMKIIDFKKKKKVINKRTVGITWKCKNLLKL